MLLHLIAEKLTLNDSMEFSKTISVGCSENRVGALIFPISLNTSIRFIVRSVGLNFSSILIFQGHQTLNQILFYFTCTEDIPPNTSLVKKKN